ncbi:MAG TPA: ABC transporter ATP-binding protein [Anaerolineales bacterium]|nr:ABC transporter ATP-binding protein [Anaerolineales bacterium]HMV96725.1 ABC transporter ATP-binding protein [Anaerolineales bacterium]HMX20147.1 ABC transporter ATP-binding protein [Anaerolineales bacterium]HMX74201.1 ABC transporter ATP-binding protein [Anaerolineales bacterium]HMZ42847.1 ABC transporter ATP-binding protein [Anaerolineales bacterium]
MQQTHVRRIVQKRPERTKSKGGMRRAIKYLTNYKRQAALPYLFLIVATLSQLAVPNMIRRVIDAVTSGYIADQILGALDKIPAQFIGTALPQILDVMKYPAEWTADQLKVQLEADVTNAPQLLTSAIVAILVFAILRGVFAFLQAYWAEKNSQAVAYDLRNDLYSKIQTLSFSYHDKNQTGQLMIRATDDVEKVRLFIGQGLLQLIGAFILLAGTVIILFSTNVSLAWAVMPILPVALVLFIIFAGASRPMFAQVQQKLSALNTVLQENLAGIKVIKAFTRETQQQDKFKARADDTMEQAIKLSRLFTFMFPLVFMIANLGQAAILYVGGKAIMAGTLSLGEWQEFSMYLMYLFMPIMMMGMIITQFGQASASADRIFEILDAKNDIADKPGAVKIPAVKGTVKFEDVTFRYFGGGDPVLSNVTFEAKPGETIALLGATGSGKTTIINLLPRFYDPTEGRITIDGYELRDVTLESLRSQIGIVLQETTLFSGSIRDNIAFGKPDASQEEIEAAAKAAQAHDFIMSFPEGYNTHVGERGTTLSGGQKQRVAIARALLLNPRILILDDSTSSVDLNTEAAIQSALDVLMKGRTSFVIAQRISTVMNADKIIVLEKGRVVAIGKHADLLEDDPIYAEIYNSQILANEHEKEGAL